MIKRAKSDANISNFNDNIFMGTKNIENNIENVDCTGQSYSNESDDDNKYWEKNKNKIKCRL